MENCILDNLTIAVEWVNFTEWLSRQSIAVSGFTQFMKNEGKSVINILQKISLQKNQAGTSCKPLQAAGWRKLIIKKVGILTKSIRDNITTHAMTKKWRKPLLSAGCVNK